MATQFQPESLTQIGRYAVVRFLAEGGMSWVFEGGDPELLDGGRAIATREIVELSPEGRLARVDGAALTHGFTASSRRYRLARFPAREARPRARAESP